MAKYGGPDIMELLRAVRDDPTTHLLAQRAHQLAQLGGLTIRRAEPVGDFADPHLRGLFDGLHTILLKNVPGPEQPDAILHSATAKTLAHELGHFVTDRNGVTAQARQFPVTSVFAPNGLESFTDYLAYRGDPRLPATGKVPEGYTAAGYLQAPMEADYGYYLSPQQQRDADALASRVLARPERPPSQGTAEPMPDVARSMQLQLRVRGQDGSEQTLQALANDGDTLGTLRQKLAGQGMQLLDARRMAAAPPPPSGDGAQAATMAPGPAAPVATPDNTTTSPPGLKTVTSSPQGGRSFASRIPQAGGAALGASALPLAASAFLGPMGPLAALALGAAGAGLGGAAGEAAQAGAERMDAVPQSAPGTPMQRAVRGGLESGATQGVVGGVGLAAQALLKPLSSVASAIADLKDTPAAGPAVRGVTGKMASLKKLLASPDTLAAFEAHPDAQASLARSWWEAVAPKGIGAVTKAWDALGDEAQTALFGDQAASIGTLVSKLNPLAGAGAKAEGGVALASKLFGLGPTLPAMAVGEFLRSSAAPSAAANLARSPFGASLVTGARTVAQHTIPPASFLTSLGAQTGTAGIVPGRRRH